MEIKITLISAISRFLNLHFHEWKDKIETFIAFYIFIFIIWSFCVEQLHLCINSRIYLAMISLLQFQMLAPMFSLGWVKKI